MPDGHCFLLLFTIQEEEVICLSDDDDDDDDDDNNNDEEEEVEEVEAIGEQDFLITGKNYCNLYVQEMEDVTCLRMEYKFYLRLFNSITHE